MSPLMGTDYGQLIEIGLALLMFSFVLVAANLGDTSPSWRIVAYVGQCGICTIVALLAVLNVLTAVAVPSQVEAAAGVSPSQVILGNMLEFTGAVVAPLALIPWVRTRVARLLRQFRPESAINAVALSIYVLITSVFLSLQVSTDQLKQIKASGQSPSLFFIIGTNQLPFLVISVVGVGFLVRRNGAQTLQRLGLGWPGWRWVLGALGMAVLLVIFGVVFDSATSQLTPQQSKNIQDVSNQLLSKVNTPLTAVILALAAGIGEEILFRGALQPRLGIVLAALLFAVLHTQYAISLASLEIFLLGLVLGWIRRRSGTTASIITHAGYDLILLMIPYAFEFLKHNPHFLR